MSENQEQPVKKRYQLFRKLNERISFDDIEDDIATLATPCSEVLELTDQEYRALGAARYENNSLYNVRIVGLEPWFTTSDIHEAIAKEMKRREEDEKKQAAAIAKKEAAKAKKTAMKQALAFVKRIDSKVKTSKTKTAKERDNAGDDY